MPNLEIATATLPLPVWAVACAVGLFIVIGVLTLTRAGAKFAGALLRVAAVLVGIGVVWLLYDQATQNERAAERRALDQRGTELAARAIAPGSPLACLDAVAGDTVETACETSVFASPQSVAAAVSFVSARLALLADSADFAHRHGGYESALASLRLPIEADRYGFVAHVLSVRDSCTPLLCDSYVLLHDPDRVQANLREQLFDHYVERYAADWAAHPQATGQPVAEAPATYTTAAGMPPVPVAGPSAMVPSKYDFPSASSIPAVSIMNAEPGSPPDPNAEAKPDAKADPRTTATTTTRKPARPAVRAPTPIAPQARAATAAPQPLGPPPSTVSGAAVR